MILISSISLYDQTCGVLRIAPLDKFHVHVAYVEVSKLFFPQWYPLIMHQLDDINGTGKWEILLISLMIPLTDHKHFGW